jgi:glutathione S-transferase
MTLYQINQDIEAMLGEVDPETGEILFDEAAFEDLQLARETKIENIACYRKNLAAEAAAIKAEEVALKERRAAIEKKGERLEKLLADELAGQKFQTARCAVTFRKSERVEIDEAAFLESAENAQYISYEPKFSKVDVKKAIKAGQKVTGAHIVEAQNISIK